MSNMKNLLGDMEFEGVRENLTNDEITTIFINGVKTLINECENDVIVKWLNDNLDMLSKEWMRENGAAVDVDTLLSFMRYVGDTFINRMYTS